MEAKVFAPDAVVVSFNTNVEGYDLLEEHQRYIFIYTVKRALRIFKLTAFSVGGRASSVKGFATNSAANEGPSEDL